MDNLNVNGLVTRAVKCAQITSITTVGGEVKVQMMREMVSPKIQVVDNTVCPWIPEGVQEEEQKESEVKPMEIDGVDEDEEIVNNLINGNDDESEIERPAKRQRTCIGETQNEQVSLPQIPSAVVYLDNAATTPVDADILKKMIPYFTSDFGNMHSPHAFGAVTKDAVGIARDTIANAINAKSSSIIFTSGGTESNNLAISGVVAAYRKNNPGKPMHVITTSIEHDSVLKAVGALKKQGVETTILPVTSTGLVTPERLKESIKESTILFSVVHGNNEIGTVQDLEAL
eukprot:CAMPEP_0168535004 /NCGR_PEP_ID=MMETSP0405-20121227/18357_1 /TAXON_ID=498012 /ORGANISM="Trichosphaerium sp, Strain Am-I-7 wt" /LENGTH=286 /DNA_ID=CAMNT_0008562059 /DNA_START=515 /DNA_END=1371 /DNA_ORIENTATION=+